VLTSAPPLPPVVDPTPPLAELEVFELSFEEHASNEASAIISASEAHA